MLVVAHALGVPFAREAALLAILFGAACLGLERLIGGSDRNRSRLDVAAGVLLPVGAVVGAVAGVVGTGGSDGYLVFAPLIPGLLALYAADRRVPFLGSPVVDSSSD